MLRMGQKRSSRSPAVTILVTESFEAVFNLFSDEMMDG